MEGQKCVVKTLGVCVKVVNSMDERVQKKHSRERNDSVGSTAPSTNLCRKKYQYVHNQPKTIQEH